MIRIEDTLSVDGDIGLPMEANEASPVEQFSQVPALL